MGLFSKLKDFFGKEGSEGSRLKKSFDFCELLRLNDERRINFILIDFVLTFHHISKAFWF